MDHMEMAKTALVFCQKIGSSKNQAKIFSILMLCPCILCGIFFYMLFLPFVVGFESNKLYNIMEFVVFGGMQISGICSLYFMVLLGPSLVNDVVAFYFFNKFMHPLSYLKKSRCVYANASMMVFMQIIVPIGSVFDARYKKLYFATAHEEIEFWSQYTEKSEQARNDLVKITKGLPVFVVNTSNDQAIFLCGKCRSWAVFGYKKG